MTWETWINWVASSSNIPSPTRPTAKPKDKVVATTPIAAHFIIIGDMGVHTMTPSLMINIVEYGQCDLIKHGYIIGVCKLWIGSGQFQSYDDIYWLSRWYLLGWWYFCTYWTCNKSSWIIYCVLRGSKQWDGSIVRGLSVWLYLHIIWWHFLISFIILACSRLYDWCEECKDL